MLYQFVAQINGKFHWADGEFPFDEYAVTYGAAQLFGKSAKISWLQIKCGKRLVHTS